MKVVYDEILRRFPEVRGQMREDYLDLPYLQMNCLAQWLQALPPGAINPPLIGRVKSFFDWCEQQPAGADASNDIYTMFVVGFYEKLFEAEVTHPLIAHLVSKDDLLRNADYLKTWVGEDNFAKALRHFG